MKSPPTGPTVSASSALARETAATYDLPLKLHTPVVKGAGGDIGEHLSVQVDAPDLCPRYTARLVKNIRLAPSPRGCASG